MFKKNVAFFFSTIQIFLQKPERKKRESGDFTSGLKPVCFGIISVSLKQVLQEFVEIKVRNQVSVILVEKELG